MIERELGGLELEGLDLLCTSRGGEEAGINTAAVEEVLTDRGHNAV